MDPIQKAAQLLLRLIATGLILISGLLIGLEFLAHRAKHTELNLIKIAALALLCLAGIGLLAASRRLAARLAGETDAPEADDDTPPE